MVASAARRKIWFVVAALGAAVAGLLALMPAAVASAATLAATGSSPSARTTTTSASFSLNETYYDVCTDEDVAFSGRTTDVHVVTLDGHGGYHDVEHTAYQGIKGIGETSGRTYLLVGVYNDVEYLSGRVGEVKTTVQRLHMISPGPASNFTYFLTLHQTVNANGAVTSYIAKSRIECS